MKNTLLGLMAATLVATPALATSWRTELFSRLDTDTNGLVSVVELEQTGCRVNKKLFAYADANRDAGLTKVEFFNNPELFSRCK